MEVVNFKYPSYGDGNTIFESDICGFYTRLAEAMAVDGLDLHAIIKVPEELECAGFINVNRSIIDIPVGEWQQDPEMKAIGKEFEEVVRSEIPSIGMREIQENLGWSWEEVVVLGALARRSLGFSTAISFPLHTVIGQKPTNEQALVTRQEEVRVEMCVANLCSTDD
jgi:hypothetical protein